MWGYDISLRGSTVQSGRTPEEAFDKAVEVSRGFAGQLIRVHDVDGMSVLAEYRDGKQLASV
jgi:hypothetical protein